ncbi:hypothetical protein KFE25_000317 [Diacronema lutheri]|uniref:Uncharacterized protein n=1 Tax=Diacronema lutheri TaxID=2081491 RepID=A0A8J6CDE0_DIALT|nr:hypothetical protein KFE25_000317 [Diacronema lutheri]
MPSAFGLPLVASALSVGLAFTRLSRDGSWRGCVISGAWCAGPGQLASADGEAARRLLQGCVCSIALANLLTLRARGAPAGWLAATIVAQLGVLVAALVPMSCAALVDGTGWVYVGWNDAAHDTALAIVFFAAALARWLAPPPPLGRGAVLLARLPMRTLVGWVAGAAAPCAICGLFACPTLETRRSKLLVLAAEVAALLCAQLAHTLTCVEFARGGAEDDAAVARKAE